MFRINMNDDDVEKLILLVKNYPELYDINSKHYNNQLRRDNIWNDISKEIGESTETCKTKWKSLRDAFHRVERSCRTKSGQAAKSKRRWRFWQIMSFLVPYIKTRAPRSNLTAESGEEDISNNHIDKHDENYTDDDFHEDSKDDSIAGSTSPLATKPDETYSENTRLKVITSSLATKPDETYSENTRLKVIPRSTNKKRNADTVPDLFKECMEQKRRKTEEMEGSRSEDGDALLEFFINMGKTVKTFPPYLQAKVKNNVFKIVNSIEMDLLCKGTNPLT